MSAINTVIKKFSVFFAKKVYAAEVPIHLNQESIEIDTTVPERMMEKGLEITKTGNSDSIIFWIVLATISITLLFLLIINSRKNN